MSKVTRYLWHRAAILALAIVVGWITGSFTTGLIVAVLVFFAVVLASRLRR